MNIEQIIQALLKTNFKLEFNVTGKRFDKDWQRVSAFVKAIELKSKWYLTEALKDPAKAAPVVAEAIEFGQAARDLVTAYARRVFDVAKNPFRFLFMDPFKALREEVRQFAAKFDLDPDFRALL